MKLSEELQARGFINQISAESLAEVLDGEKRTVYHGIEPTAESAHAGNFVIWMLLRHLANDGHRIIFLVGGGTGMIGDPKPDVERSLVEQEVVASRANKIKTQAERLLNNTEILFVNNYDWLSKINLITFLRDIGKHFTVNELIKKDAIASRLRSESGLSYTEFAYPLLQAYDYLELYREQGSDLQVGGADQWGNIIAGVDLVRRVEQKKVYALTVPLIIDKATGKKFGKSEGNAIWLDATKTSPYAFYQFWLSTSDDSVIDYLKLFTLLPLPTVADIEKSFVENPSSRSAQTILAQEVTAFVHGKESAESCANVSHILFSGGDIAMLKADDKIMLVQNAPVFEVPTEQSLVDILVESGLASSNREARTFIEGGAVTLSTTKVDDVSQMVTLKGGDIVPLRRGKKHFVILFRK